MPGETIAKSINDGFGQTLGKIGMIIVLGVIIGKFLEKSGGAFAMAEKIIQLMGKKNVTAAMDEFNNFFFQISKITSSHVAGRVYSVMAWQLSPP